MQISRLELYELAEDDRTRAERDLAKLSGLSSKPQ